MAPPGRRRQTSAYSIAIAFLLFFTTSASAAVLGIDFGTLNIKAVLVKPGIPLDIVLTKDSKRKETAAIAFKAARDNKGNVVAESGSFPERAYGADALALQGRMPGEVFPNLKPLLGLQEEALSVYQTRYPAIQFADGSIKSSAFHASESPFSVEEVLAMELASIRRNAENMAGKGVSVENVVITTPVFYTAAEKFAVRRAAELAGLNVMALVSDGLAVGLDYAKSRTFLDVTEGGKPEHHLVFDMGAGSTTATVLRFQGRTVKDTGRFNKTVQEVAVLGTGWDRTLGGDALTQVVAEEFINKFMTKPVIKSRGIQLEEVQKNGRLMGRIWKDAEKARQVLSANSETTSSFEELLPDIDFKTKLSRTDFEKLTESFAERVIKPIEDALAGAQLTINDIDSVILFGGAIRTPFVHKKLEQFAGPAKLKSNVNADESAVFGAAFKAASLSPSFKVKEIRSSDNAGYAAGLSIPSDGKERYQVVFSAASGAGNNGTTKQISFKNKEDFSFALYQKVTSDVPFAQVTTSNLTASVKALKDKFGCGESDISTKFSLKLSAVDGLPDVVVGTVSCDTDGKASVGDSVKDWLGLGKKRDTSSSDDDEGSTEELTATDTSSTTSSSDSASASAAASKAAEKPKKRTESFNVAFTVKSTGQPSSAELEKMRERLLAFDASDKARYAREDALNALESYTYYVRDFLSNTDYDSFSTQAQREAISKLLSTTRDFMDSGDLAKSTEKIFKDKLKGLKDLITPIVSRRSESTARPEPLKALKKSLDQTQNFIDNIKKEVEKAKDAAASSVAEASKSAASVAEAATSAIKGEDELDDLEEPTPPEATPTSKSKIDELIQPYTDEDITSIHDIYTQVSTWLTEREGEQAKLKLFDDPAFTVKDIEKKAKQLSDAMMELVQKKIRVPKKSTSSKKKTSKTKAPKKSSTSAEAAESATDIPTEGKPKIIGVNEGDDLPSEEEILSMVSQAKASASAKDEL